MHEDLERGLSPDTHDKASMGMYQTYVRDVPNGTGNVCVQFELSGQVI